MLKSMTGFGRASGETKNLKVTVEIRCLNSRSLDVIMKAPSYFRECEQDIRSKIAEKLLRGKVDVWITLEVKNPAISGRLNTTLAEAYYRDMKAFASNVNESGINILDSVFKMPDIFKAEDNTADEADVKALMNALDNSLNKVNEFRLKEGATLEEDIHLRIKNIGEGLLAIAPYEMPRVDRHRKRLKENLHAALGLDALDANRFEEELIYYLEKIDITEEKVRLQSHLNYFMEASKLPDAGRKLGFLSQEIGREINTIGSKANDAEIQKIVVGMKDELEKVKEQLLNIL
jgi:uncharacterized protein (TIGR00255 family)